MLQLVDGGPRNIILMRGADGVKITRHEMGRPGRSATRIDDVAIDYLCGPAGLGWVCDVAVPVGTTHLVPVSGGGYVPEVNPQAFLPGKYHT